MPHATEILDGLVALAAGWRPSRCTARILMGMPLASVAGVAIVFDNPFNGLVFAASALTLTAMAMSGDRRPVSLGSAWMRAIGVATIAFGWVYPHFLKGGPVAYLYASPVGLVPCPTLAVAIGFALVGNGLGSRVWSLALAVLGLFYGLFGVLHLSVLLDIGLVGGALALGAAACSTPKAVAARSWHIDLILAASARHKEGRHGGGARKPDDALEATVPGELHRCGRSLSDDGGLLQR